MNQRGAGEPKVDNPCRASKRAAIDYAHALKHLSDTHLPEHGSWLDMAEPELGVLSTRCLDRRLPDKQTVTSEIAAWEAARNAYHAKADRQFTIADARIGMS
jgi:hypothetical protein